MSKVVLGMLLAAGAYAGAYYHGYSSAPPVQVVETRVETEVQVQTVYVDRVVYHDRVVEKVVTRETRPDGGTVVTEKETTRDTDRVEDRKVSRDVTEKGDTTHSTEIGTGPSAGAARYALGLRYRETYLDGDFLPIPSLDNTEITAGYRLVGDLWLDAAISRKDVSLGFSIQFGGGG